MILPRPPHAPHDLAPRLLQPGMLCLDDAQPLEQADQTRVFLEETLAALRRDDAGGLLTPAWQRWYRATQQEGQTWRAGGWKDGE